MELPSWPRKWMIGENPSLGRRSEMFARIRTPHRPLRVGRLTEDGGFEVQEGVRLGLDQRCKERPHHHSRMVVDHRARTAPDSEAPAQSTIATFVAVTGSDSGRDDTWTTRPAISRGLSTVNAT
jgi:hypothetical protein